MQPADRTTAFPPGARRQAPGPALPPLSLYIHIPWCIRKCPYCDFNSHENRGDLPENDYVEALLADLETDLEWVQGRPLQSIFFGGGTPSLFSADAIGHILEGVNRRIDFAPDIEITLEANPGTAEQQKFRGYRAAGVNRLSIGVQSFATGQLRALGRIHDSGEAFSAIDMARRAGFERCNIDLMHGLPGQTDEAALHDLETALSLGITHLSWYQLTIEPNTAFYSRPPELPGENLLADIQERGHARILAAGLQQYEVSAYSIDGERSRHNLNYWLFGDYLALGAGAHGKITLPGESRILRYRKTRLPEHYLAETGPRTRDLRDIEPSELPLEFMLNALRLNDGCQPATYEARTGLPWQTVAPTVEGLIQRALLERSGRAVRTTDTGRRFLNDVIEQFLA